LGTSSSRWSCTTEISSRSSPTLREISSPNSSHGNSTSTEAPPDQPHSPSSRGNSTDSLNDQGPPDQHRCTSDPRRTNLLAFHLDLTKFDQLHPDVDGFTVIKKLASGLNGDIFEYSWRDVSSSAGDERRVAVKKFENSLLDEYSVGPANEWHIHRMTARERKKVKSPEDPLAEIGVLSYLAQQPHLSHNFLRMQKVFAESSGRFTWLVMELAEGELFKIAASEIPIQEADAQRYSNQLLGAIKYLHDHHIGHRDVSLENVLLKGGCAKLVDFGMAVRTHSDDEAVELRYFRAVGKNTYRAPECYVPKSSRVDVVVPSVVEAPGQVVMTRTTSSLTACDQKSCAANMTEGIYYCEVKLPMDAVPGKSCKAKVWGYTATRADIFASGVCIFMLLYQCPPWQRAVLTDPRFVAVHGGVGNGLESLLKNWNKPVSPVTLNVLTQLLHIEPSKRPSAAEALNLPWLTLPVSAGANLA
jgi:serine/threonine protein kinase